MKTHVLFICTHNSARSQLAEGLLRHLYGDRYEASSAGTVATSVHPLARRVLEEMGIDTSPLASKTVTELAGTTFDVVVTVCDHARETCPIFPGKRILHQAFEDPGRVEGLEEKRLEAFRRAREKIQSWIETTFGREGSI